MTVEIGAVPAGTPSQFQYGLMGNNLKIIQFKDATIEEKQNNMFVAWHHGHGKLPHTFMESLEHLPKGITMYNSKSMLDWAIINHIREAAVDYEIAHIELIDVQGAMMRNDVFGMTVMEFCDKFSIYTSHHFAIIYDAYQRILKGEQIAFISPYFRFQDTSVRPNASARIIPTHRWCTTFAQKQVCYFELARQFPDQVIPSLLMPHHRELLQYAFEMMRWDIPGQWPGDGIDVFHRLGISRMSSGIYVPMIDRYQPGNPTDYGETISVDGWAVLSCPSNTNVYKMQIGYQASSMGLRLGTDRDRD